MKNRKTENMSDWSTSKQTEETKGQLEITDNRKSLDQKSLKNTLK